MRQTRSSSVSHSPSAASDFTLTAARAPHALLQRKCACGQHTAGGGSCGACAERETTLRRSAARGRAGDGAAIPPVVHDVLRSPGQPLDGGTRALMETRFGHDFSGVRVHDDSRAAESAGAVGARAYTVGREVVFGGGQYAPATRAGQSLLAHELAHVVQQRDLPGQLSASSLVSEPTDAAEREADRAAAAVDQSLDPPPIAAQGGGIQRQSEESVGGGVGAAAAAAALGGFAGGAAKAVAAALKTGSFAVNMTAFNTGLEGTIEFTPDAKNCPKCNLIRLVQTVRVFEKPGEDYKWTGGEANREKVKTAEDTTKGIKPNFFVDHLAANCSEGNKCSLYYRDHAPNSAKSQDGSNDGVTPKVASLWDRPAGDANDVFEFETCARCNDTGAYLRCVDWGFTADAAGKATSSATSEHVAPTATFTAAVGAFDKFYKN